MACVRRGLHVLVTKPVVMTLEHHRLLHEVRLYLLFVASALL